MERVILYYKFNPTMAFLLCLLFLLSAGSIGTPLAASGQEETGPRHEDNLDSVICEPMMSNVTIPSTAEDALPPKIYLVY
jgi:hypothetical protein